MRFIIMTLFLITGCATVPDPKTASDCTWAGSGYMACMDKVKKKEKAALIASKFDPEKNPWIKNYVGKKGYFIRPVYMNLGDKLNYDFKRCEPAEIKAILPPENQSESDVKIEVSQNGKVYYLLTVDDVSVGMYENKISALDNYFVEKLPAKWKTSKKLCSGTIWVGMSEGDFKFARGSSAKINRTVVGNSSTEQWVMRKSPWHKAYESEYYYFRKGVLTSWQN